MYIGKLYIDGRDVVLILAILLVAVAKYAGWDIPLVNKDALLAIGVLVLLTRGIIPSVHNEVFFFHALTTLVLSIFIVNTLQIIIFYVATFFLLKLVKIV